MHTPPLRRRLLVLTLGVLAAVLVLSKVIVYLAMRPGLSGADAPVGASTRLLGVQLLASLAVLLAAYLALNRVVRAVTEPLRRLAGGAERIAEGSTDWRAEPDDPTTELGQLAAAFDRMAEEVDAAIAEARASDERSRRFLQDAAHQLRTPIAGIRASMEALLTTHDLAERDRLSANLVRETARATRIVNSLLHIARLERGRPMAVEETDLRAVIESEADRARSLAPHLVLHLRAAADGPPLELDGEQMREAIANLFDNARRHALSRISIELVRNERGARLSITDDGPGVPPGAELLIFERFATLDGAGGSGLGLPIARTIVRAHGGELWYERDTFFVVIPRHGHDRRFDPHRGDPSRLADEITENRW